MTAPFMTVACMPMSTSSSTVQPCTTALWPIETRAPILSGEPLSTCSEQASCTLLSSPIVIGSSSARRLAPGQIPTRSPSETAPAITTFGITSADFGRCGVCPGSGMIVARSWTVMAPG